MQAIHGQALSINRQIMLAGQCFTSKSLPTFVYAAVHGSHRLKSLLMIEVRGVSSGRPIVPGDLRGCAVPAHHCCPLQFAATGQAHPSTPLFACLLRNVKLVRRPSGAMVPGPGAGAWRRGLRRGGPAVR